jgi:NAD(P)-dependent dehydrogenase (short-subunit alcohol dehydrogenase family)
VKKVALVTGGSRGIGLGIAQALARDGFDLGICGVRPESGAADSLKVLRDTGRDVIYIQADVSVTADRERLIGTMKSHFGRLNVLVNNAGVAPLERQDILEATEESFERLVRINLQGPYFLTQSAANWMIALKRSDPAFTGCIINVSSISATVASVNRGDYCITKAGISMATQLFAARLGEWDIPVYEIRPGIIKTDMTSGVTSKYDKLIDEGLLVQGRWGTPEDTGRAAAMLARGDLAYSTGQVIMVDGGHSVKRL